MWPCSLSQTWCKESRGSSWCCCAVLLVLVQPHAAGGHVRGFSRESANPRHGCSGAVPLAARCFSHLASRLEKNCKILCASQHNLGDVTQVHLFGD